MAERIGKYTLKFGSRPGIIASAAIVGSKEGDGPLGGNFDEIITDGTFGEKTWEKAESAFQHRAVVKAIEKSGMTAADIDMLMAGDLLSQCSGSAFGARDLGIPFVGLYGACSTMALSLALAAAECRFGCGAYSRRGNFVALLLGGEAVPHTARIRRSASSDCPVDGDGGRVRRDRKVRVAAYRSRHIRQDNRLRSQRRKQHGCGYGARRVLDNNCLFAGHKNTAGGSRPYPDWRPRLCRLNAPARADEKAGAYRYHDLPQ